MAITPAQSRLMLAVSTVLLVAVGTVVAFGVIPPVRVSAAPDITPGRAVPAFWVSTGLQILAAIVVLLTAALSKGRTRSSTAGLVVTGVLVLFLGFALSDAAAAFREAGMRSVASLLLACVAADAVAGALVITTAFIRPKDASGA